MKEKRETKHKDIGVRRLAEKYSSCEWKVGSRDSKLLGK